MKPQLRRTGRQAFTLAAMVLLPTPIGPGIAEGWIAQADPITTNVTPSPVTSRNENPGVLPANSKSHGNSYGEWGAQWWIWATEQPFATSPLFDESGEYCQLGQSGSVWFLARILGGGTAERYCSVPAGKSLFFPIANGLSFAPDFGNSEEEIRADVANDLAGN